MLSDDAPISPMTPAQADAQMARMALQIGWPQKIAGPLADAALKENTSDPTVRALSARIAALNGGHQDIEDLASALERGGTDDAQLRIDVAATLLSLSQSKLSGDRSFAILDDLARSGSAPLEAVGLMGLCGAIDGGRLGQDGAGPGKQRRSGTAQDRSAARTGRRSRRGSARRTRRVSVTTGSFC